MGNKPVTPTIPFTNSAHQCFHFSSRWQRCLAPARQDFCQGAHLSVCFLCTVRNKSLTSASCSLWPLVKMRHSSPIIHFDLGGKAHIEPCSALTPHALVSAKCGFLIRDNKRRLFLEAFYQRVLSKNWGGFEPLRKSTLEAKAASSSPSIPMQQRKITVAVMHSSSYPFAAWTNVTVYGNMVSYIICDILLPWKPSLLIHQL